jgi:capsular exopolysaccharide synthesis family protein
MPGKKNREQQGQIVANSAKTLFANIRFMSVDNPVHTIAITSSVPNEGKTFVSTNLASAIASSGASTLLVECDMRHRSVATRIGVHAQFGLYSVITEQVSIEQAAVQTSTPNLYFLDAEPHIPNPSDILNSRHFQRFLDSARERFTYVIFDTPPVTTFVDAAVLGTKVDAVLLVARENFVKRADVMQAVEQLKASGCNLAGVIMNGCDFGKNNSGYYSYYYESGSSNKGESGDSSAPKFVKAPTQRPERRQAQNVSASSEGGAQQSVPAGPPSREQRQGSSQRKRTHMATPDDTIVYQQLAQQSRAARAGRTIRTYEDDEY